MKLHSNCTSDLAVVTTFLRHHYGLKGPNLYQYERDLLADVEQRPSDSRLLPLLRYIYDWGARAKRERTLADHEREVMAATVRLFRNLADADSPAMRHERCYIFETKR